jgi:hypothetical protein
VATPDDPTPHVSFDEYRLYYESAERVTDRRLEVNRWNYSIAVTTLIAIGLVLVWGTSNPTREFVGIIGVVLLSVMAFLHCSFWVRQIDDFKALNTEKFTILNDMAPHVRFQPAGPYERIGSGEPFRREWDAMIEDNAIREINRTGLRRMVALRSTGAEYFIPNAFRFLFVFVAIGTLGLGLLDHNRISPFDYCQQSPAQQNQQVCK